MDIKDIIYKETVIPSLNDSTYGETIAKNFEIINDNFKRLSGIDFIKGAPGTSIFVDEIDLMEEVYWREALKASIVAMEDKLGGTNEVDNDNTRFSILDKNPGKLYMIYEQTPELNDKKYISSLPYVFLDGRFANKKLTEQADKYADEYAKMVDYSCVLNFSPNSEEEIVVAVDETVTGMFAVLQNFPTLYYDRRLGFCWNVNGQETGISAQGPKGIDGQDGELFIVRANEADNFKVVSVMDVLSGGWVSVKDHVNINKRTSVSAIVVPNNPIQNNGLMEYPYWITSVVRNNNGDYYATNCTNDSKIAVIINDISFDSILSNISSTGAGVKGLFLPMKKKHGEEDVTVGYHMVYTEGKDTHIKPVLDKNLPISGSIVNDAKLVFDYNSIKINSEIESKKISSGGFANEDKIRIGKDGKEGAMLVITSDPDDLMKHALNSSEGIKEIAELLIKYDLINPNRFITTPLKKIDEIGADYKVTSYYEKQVEVPSTTFYIPSGNMNVQKKSVSYAEKTGTDADNKSSNSIKTTTINGQQVQFLEWERKYKSQKVYELVIGGMLTAPLLFPMESDKKNNYSDSVTYMFSLVLDVYIDKYHHITYSQDQTTKGNALDAGGNKIITAERYEYETKASIDSLKLRTFSQLIGDEQAKEPTRISFDDQIAPIIRDVIDYDA